MADIFLQRDTTSLLDNRFIVFIGDSNMRGVYKDLVLLLQKNKYLHPRQLRKKGEKSFEGDTLIEGGTFGEMSNGVNYREIRQYRTDYHLARFYFVTRCYNSYMESILSDLAKEPQPDVVIMNSCLWDISRYGSSAVDDYKENLEILFKRLKDTLPDNCLVIWCTTLPISKYIRGGFMIPQVAFMNSNLRLDLLEANFFVHKLMKDFKFDILDLHYHLRHQLQRRAEDGVHWDQTAHRRISNLILSHIADAWGVKSASSDYSSLSLESAYNKHYNDVNNDRVLDNRSKVRDFSRGPSNFSLGPGQFNKGHNNFNPGPNNFSSRADNFNPRPDNFSSRPDNFNPRLNNFDPGQMLNQRSGVLNAQPNNLIGDLRVLADNVARNVSSIETPLNNMNFVNPHRNFLNNCVMMVPLQGQVLNADFCGEQYPEEQQENTDRYGGPIRQPAWDMSNISAQQFRQVNLVNNPYQWEPYQNINNSLVMKTQMARLGGRIAQGPYNHGQHGQFTRRW